MRKVILLILSYPVLPQIFLSLRGCLGGGSVYVSSFRSKEKENLQHCGGVVFDILITSEGTSALAIMF